jgi:predicted esterase
VKVFGLHGADDETVSMARSRTEHEVLLGLGFSGEFRVIEKMQHRIDPRLGGVAQGLIENI